METLAGFPFFKLDFTRDGKVDAEDRDALIAALGERDDSDLLVLSHGWNNDTAEARALYAELLGNMRTLIDAGHAFAADRKPIVAGLFWPSKKFTDDSLRPDAVADGGVASAEGRSLDTALLREKLDRLADLLGEADPAMLEAARSALGGLEEREADRRQFVTNLLALLPPPQEEGDELPLPDQAVAAGDAVRKLEEPVRIAGNEGGGGLAAVGGGAEEADESESSLGSLWSGMKAGAWRLLNYATYYVMKERAGHVGRGLNGVLAQARQARPDIAIHLAGHSFGARAVTAAVSGDTPFAPRSLTLLQGAFSHNGFAPAIDGQPGFFRKVVAESRVAGPIVATHTRNDKAVGIAYAIASRLSGDMRAEIGGPDDKFGGIGRNGAVRMGTGEAVAARLEDAAHVYAGWQPSRITNLLADAYIGDHGDVRGREVANALLTAMA